MQPTHTKPTDADAIVNSQSAGSYELIQKEPCPDKVNDGKGRTLKIDNQSPANIVNTPPVPTKAPSCDSGYSKKLTALPLGIPESTYLANKAQPETKLQHEDEDSASQKSKKTGKGIDNKHEKHEQTVYSMDKHYKPINTPAEIIIILDKIDKASRSHAKIILNEINITLNHHNKTNSKGKDSIKKEADSLELLLNDKNTDTQAIQDKTESLIELFKIFKLAVYQESQAEPQAQQTDKANSKAKTELNSSADTPLDGVVYSQLRNYTRKIQSSDIKSNEEIKKIYIKAQTQIANFFLKRSVNLKIEQEILIAIEAFKSLKRLKPEVNYTPLIDQLESMLPPKNKSDNNDDWKTLNPREFHSLPPTILNKITHLQVDGSKRIFKLKLKNEQTSQHASATGGINANNNNPDNPAKKQKQQPADNLKSEITTSSESENSTKFDKTANKIVPRSLNDTADAGKNSEPFAASSAPAPALSPDDTTSMSGKGPTENTTGTSERT